MDSPDLPPYGLWTLSTSTCSAKVLFFHAPTRCDEPHFTIANWWPRSIHCCIVEYTSTPLAFVTEFVHVGILVQIFTLGARRCSPVTGRHPILYELYPGAVWEVRSASLLTFWPRVRALRHGFVADSACSHHRIRLWHQSSLILARSSQLGVGLPGGHLGLSALSRGEDGWGGRGGRGGHG